MRALGEQFTAQRLLQMLTVLQSALADLPRSGNRRTDTELCLIRLCDESLDQSLAGLAARVARLEERLTQGGIPAQPQTQVQTQPVPRQAPRPARPQAARPAPSPQVQEDRPTWEEERPPLPEEPPAPGEMERVFDVPEAEPVRPAARPTARPAVQPAPQQSAPAGGPPDGDRAFWPSFAAGLKGKIPPTVHPYLNNAQKVTGVWKNGSLTLWTDSEFTRAMLNKPAVLAGLKRAAADSFGGDPQVSVVCGTPPPEEPVSAPAPNAAPAEQQAEPPQKDTGDAMDALLAFGEQFDNVTIQ